MMKKSHLQVRQSKKATQAKSEVGSTKEKPQPFLQRFKELLSSWAMSLFLHVVVILILASLTLPLPMLPEVFLQTSQVEEEALDIEEDLLAIDVELEQESLEEPVDEEFESELQEEDVVPAVFDAGNTTLFESTNDLFESNISTSELVSAPVASGLPNSGLDGREAANKAYMLMRGGGTKSSENAVSKGLDWLMRHQYPDGTWNFDHTRDQCNGQCANAGTYIQARAGATGLALMTYLGAGHTHQKGRYKRVVYDGIAALTRLIKIEEEGGSFWDPQGRMYSHGIATMALCEAYALTADSKLHDISQSAVNYVSYAQDPKGGGWRYEPQQAGDTSVMGWQIGALKSGYLSDLRVPRQVVEKAGKYLDTMMVEQGGRYLYDQNRRNERPAVTAVGLLCRMYMGIDHDDPGLKRGIEYLSKRGPSTQDAYYNYYAAQVMFHYTSGDGPIWKKWNDEMRSMLVETQVKDGHALGSWTPAEEGDHGSKPGGRLYTTALSTMTLEVYYRLLPIYRSEVVSGEFELAE